jgi:hypothetical protein
MSSQDEAEASHERRTVGAQVEALRNFFDPQNAPESREGGGEPSTVPVHPPKADASIPQPHCLKGDLGGGAEGQATIGTCAKLVESKSMVQPHCDR